MRIFLRQWQVAYRLLPQGSVFSDLKTPFITIPNSLRYTAADPFLIENNGITYLFAEIYDKKDGLGKIGYSVFDGKKFSQWKIVISEKYHLSYPNIFEYKNNMYIVPESNESNTLYAYKATEFPGKWKKINPLIIENRKLVDTTFLDYDGRHLMFTYDIADQENKKLFIYDVNEDGKVKPYTDEYVTNDDACARPGGNFFRYKDENIRVSQNCDGDYGIGVVFSRIKECSAKGYSEEKLLEISPSTVMINKKFISGLHTYNANDKMEVIDFHVVDFDPLVQVRRILEKLGLRK